MKRFLGKLFTFTIIIISIFWAVNILFIKMDKSDSDYTNKFSNIPDTLDVCNFGSSHGLFGFNYEDVQYKGYACFNFGLVSQYISYDYRLIQHYGNHIGEGTIVFIPVSYFSLFGKSEEDHDDFESKNKAASFNCSCIPAVFEEITGQPNPMASNGGILSGPMYDANVNA